MTEDRRPLLERLRTRIDDAPRPTRDDWASICTMLDQAEGSIEAELTLVDERCAGWSAHARSVAFTADVADQPWWPWVRGLHFADAEGVEQLEGFADHITHVSLHEDASLSSHDLEDLRWLPACVPNLRYFMLDGPNEVPSLAPLARLEQLQDVLLIGYSCLDTSGAEGLESLNALPHLRRLIAWQMALENIDTLPLRDLDRLKLLELPRDPLLALAVEELDNLRLLTVNNAHSLDMDEILDSDEADARDNHEELFAWLERVAALPCLERLVLHYEGKSQEGFAQDVERYLGALMPDRVTVEVLDNFETYPARFFRFGEAEF